MSHILIVLEFAILQRTAQEQRKSHQHFKAFTSKCDISLLIPAPPAQVCKFDKF